MRLGAAPIALIALLAIPVMRLAAQGVATQCASTSAPAPPSAANRRAARELATRARETAITSELSAARGLYEQAATLDPTDPETAYALGRIYEQARDPRAIAQYCRFLALSPNATEAGDVRRRVGALAFELTPRTAAAPSPPSPPSPGNAITLGILFPGGGQYYTRRPALGLLITAATAGALFYGLQSRTRSDTTTATATDPFGNPYRYPVVHTVSTRPNLAAGAGAAAGLWLIAALEAFGNAHHVDVAQHPTRAAVMPLGDRLGVGVRFALAREP